MSKLPAVILGSKFTFFKTDQGKDIPNNCPRVINEEGVVVNDNPETGEKPAIEEYKTMGIYPVTLLAQKAFREMPTFDWKGWWKDKCSGDGLTAIVEEDEILEKFDKMQKNELGNLVTGVTTMTGNIGQKAIRDGDIELAGNIYDQLIGFKNYIESGIKHNEFPDSKLNKKACDKDHMKNCEDAIARTMLGIGKMTVAAIDSGLAKKGRASKSLVNRTIENLGDEATKDDFMKKPYKHGADTLYRCMIESKDGSLKRDICTSMIKDVIVAGIKAKQPHVYKDALKHLTSYYDKDYFSGKKETWDDMKTWVNATVWMTDALIDVVELENSGVIEKDNPGTEKLLKSIKKQKSEKLTEFSTVDWITQLMLVITSKKGVFNRHDEIIRDINQDRLSVWNSWLNLYTDNFKRCPPESMKCMGDTNSPANKALKQLAAGINLGCINPIAAKIKKGKELTTTDNEALDVCSKAIGDIIKKAGDEVVLKEATEAYFLFGQKDGGVQYIDKVEKSVNEAINERFKPSFIRRMTGKRETDPIEEGDTLIQAYQTDLFKRRFDRPANKEETKILNDLLGRDGSSRYSLFRNHFLDVKTVGSKEMEVKLIKDDDSPLFIIEHYKEKDPTSGRYKKLMKPVPKSVIKKLTTKTK